MCGNSEQKLPNMFRSMRKKPLRNIHRPWSFDIQYKYFFSLGHLCTRGWFIDYVLISLNEKKNHIKSVPQTATLYLL